jgi:hypothetical protein
VRLGGPVHRLLHPHVQQHDPLPWTPSRDRQPVVEPPAGFTLLLGDVVRRIR